MMPKLWYRCDNWVNTVWENDLPSGAFATTLTWDLLVPGFPFPGAAAELLRPPQMGFGLGLPDAITEAIRQKKYTTQDPIYQTHSCIFVRIFYP